ncbi:MAG TPA: YetF domain-containing protein [Planctomycetota bacterium]
MEVIVRALAMYVLLWLIFRVSGKRTLKDMTTFDFIMLLIVSECTQEGLIGQDPSVTGAFLAVGTLVGIDILLSLLKRRHHGVEKVLDNVPVILIEKGRMHADRMKKERVDEADILASARETRGIARLDRIDYAILETNGMISVIPKE